MSMLNFHINRAGRKLSKTRRAISRHTLGRWVSALTPRAPMPGRAEESQEPAAKNHTYPTGQ
jgi:hypothetical protein